MEFFVAARRRRWREFSAFCVHPLRVSSHVKRAQAVVQLAPRAGAAARMLRLALLWFSSSHSNIVVGARRSASRRVALNSLRAYRSRRRLRQRRNTTARALGHHA